jgi:glycosyltransferase involved in cell wall biosynthesis
MRYWLGPLELNLHAGRLRELITEISPDLVHAMRIPFEGIMAAKSMPAGVPLLISVWGNDFTLFAASNPLIARQTRNALQRADALHSDCHRDMRLAIRDWGFDSKKPSTVLPGSGGVRTSLFYPEPEPGTRAQMNIAPGAPVVINPRGFRTYVRNDVFFQAMPLVLKQRPEAVFVCTGMQGSPVAEKWASELVIKDNVRLLPVASHDEMANLFRASDITVSPSQHDGTPNSLLEAMACGCFPVAGNIESVREWITDGENGLLCDPTDKESIARAILRALEDRQLRDKARAYNLSLVTERAEYENVMTKAEEFYHQVAQASARPVQV